MTEKERTEEISLSYIRNTELKYSLKIALLPVHLSSVIFLFQAF